MPVLVFVTSFKRNGRKRRQHTAQNDNRKAVKEYALTRHCRGRFRFRGPYSREGMVKTLLRELVNDLVTARY
jgi:hypothetical protein